MPAKLDRCVADVNKDSDVDNAYAVCNASIGEAFIANGNYQNMPQEGGVGSGIKGHTTAKDQPQGKGQAPETPPEPEYGYRVQDPATSSYPDELTFLPTQADLAYNPDDADLTPEDWKERSKFWIDHAASGISLDSSYSAEDLEAEFGLPPEWNNKVINFLRTSLARKGGGSEAQDPFAKNLLDKNLDPAVVAQAVKDRPPVPP